MKPCFVTTENVKRLMLGYSNLKNRGAAEACLMVVDGFPGLGKTGATAWFATQNDSLYVRAKKKWTAATAMADIAIALQGGITNEFEPSRLFSKNFEYVYKALETRAAAAQKNGVDFAIILDEADYFIKNDEILESFRDLADLTEIPIIFVGMGMIRQSLTKFPQVASRVSEMVLFEALTEKDVKALVVGLCEFKIEDKFISYITQVSRGYFREVYNAIAAIENFASRQGSDVTVTMEMMAGQRLFFDRATNKPLMVKA